MRRPAPAWRIDPKWVLDPMVESGGRGEGGRVDNDALVAALGRDAVAAVTCYRELVAAEGARRGLRLIGGALVDPTDIRLRVGPSRRMPWLTGRLLCWGPATGWSITHRAGDLSAYYAGPAATPLQLVPTAVEVVRWAAGAIDGPAVPPVGVELDDDPRAIQRLLAFIAAARPDPAVRRTG
jgi:hypothetical protein